MKEECARIRDVLLDLAYGARTGYDMRVDEPTARHLIDCPECAGYFRSLGMVVAAFAPVSADGHVLAPSAASADEVDLDWERLAATIEQGMRKRCIQPHSAGGPPRRRPDLLLLAGAAAAVLATLVTPFLLSGSEILGPAGGILHCGIEFFGVPLHTLVSLGRGIL